MGLRIIQLEYYVETMEYLLLLEEAEGEYFHERVPREIAMDCNFRDLIQFNNSFYTVNEARKSIYNDVKFKTDAAVSPAGKDLIHFVEFLKRTYDPQEHPLLRPL